MSKKYSDPRYCSPWNRCLYETCLSSQSCKSYTFACNRPPDPSIIGATPILLFPKLKKSVPGTIVLMPLDIVVRNNITPTLRL